MFMGVAINPGATQLAVMLREATSAAESFGHAGHAGLRRGIIRLSRITGRPNNRRDTDDPPHREPSSSPQACARSETS